jgi:hypothetical protein
VAEARRSLMTTRLLSSLRRVTLAAEHARNVDLTIGDTETPANECDRENPTMGNEEHARGVPILARGICGAMNGTRPGDKPIDFDNHHRHKGDGGLGRIP